ncbi:MAG: GNAT family N-acetyltransferase, partial [Chloroflexi bacterium]|nr:GNAT family N-acetyltransferase [Chloroflexota bacterium]
MTKNDISSIFPQLETERLILRELKSTDAESILHYLSDPEVNRYLDTDSPPAPEQAQRLVKSLISLLEKGEGFRWGITPKSGDSAGVVVGTCGFHAWNKPHFRAEIGYELAREYWGQGLMAEAIRAILKFGFEEMGLNRVEAMVLAGNNSSAGFLEKLGFQKEARLREYEFVQGKFRDVLLYSLLSQDSGSRK